MSTFGKRSGGGRRSSARVVAPLPAVITTFETTRQAVVMDVSFAGARLRGEGLPDVGEELFIKADAVDAFGTIAWADGKECGVHFDAPITRHELTLLQHGGLSSPVSTLTPEERMALADWTTGLAR